MRTGGQVTAIAGAVWVLAALGATPAAAAADEVLVAPAPGKDVDDRVERQLREALAGRIEVLPRAEGEERLASAARLGVKCGFADDECLVKLVVVADVPSILLYDAGGDVVRLALVDGEARAVRRARDARAARALAVVLGDAPPPDDRGPPADPPDDRQADPPDDRRLDDPPPPDDEPPPAAEAGPSPLLLVGGGAAALGAAGVVVGAVGVAVANAVFVDRTQPTDARLQAQTYAWTSLAVSGACAALAAAGAGAMAVSFLAAPDE